MTTPPRGNEAIFHAAREISDPVRRRSYVREACGGDESRIGHVEALLAAAETPDSLLDRPGESGAVATIDQTNASIPAAVIGPYKLIEQIGEGGMGAVWMAQQTEPVKRIVAIKLIKAGMDSRQVIARFEAERQALALMDHANIARVLDAGTTGSGRPYFVMDLVKGVPITRYCDEHRLTPRERLELFIPVCQAVQHAHQKGIIHRDLKPSNVLVALYDGRPVPKVIDFGVAKAAGQQLTDKTLVTGFGAIIGTLEYMSPEQAQINQLDVDTRSDIYSLGVLLYELLTGSPPFTLKELETVGMLEMLRVIREQEPSKPSTKLSTEDRLPSLAANRGTEPSKLAKLVRGELDWIVMKALEKDRDRRYETANGFAIDVQRYLADEPVQAHPPSTAYKLRKFVGRHRSQVAAAFLLGLALLAGIAFVLWHNRELDQKNRELLAANEAEKQAKQTAEQREAETKAVLDFVENKIFAAARPEGLKGGLGYQVTLRRAVEAALPFVNNSFTDQPLIEARLRLTLGSSFTYLGEAKIALEQYLAARALFSKYRGPDDSFTLRSATGVANSYDSLGQHAEALKLREETLAGQQAKLGPDHPDTLSSMMCLANSYGTAGRRAEALKLREAALAIQQAKLGPDHPDTLNSMQNLATGYFKVGRTADALKLYEETLAIRKAKLGPNHPDVLRNLTALASTYGTLGRRAEALRLRERVLAIQKTALGPDHPDTLNSMQNLSTGYFATGRLADAFKLREETLTLFTAKLGPDHPDTLLNMYLLAESLLSLDRGVESVPLIDECVRLAAGKVVDPQLISGVMDVRLRHFEKANDVAGARSTAELWEELKRTDAESLYTAARMRAVTAALTRANDRSDASAKNAAAEADRAMVWLRQAVASGAQNVAALQNDKDLDALRDREDFKELFAESGARDE